MVIKLPGSATALLAILDNNILRVLTVADGKLYVYRKGKLIFETPRLNHTSLFSSAPFQLGGDFTLTGLKESEYWSDKPTDGKSFEIVVEEDDLLLMVTDGINLSTETINNLVANCPDEKELVSILLAKNGYVSDDIAIVLAKVVAK